MLILANYVTKYQWRKDTMQSGDSQLWHNYIHSVNKQIGIKVGVVASQGAPALVDIFYQQFFDKMNAAAEKEISGWLGLRALLEN